MVQEFYVLKCHSCELFQVHIVKKAKKWSCKVCGEKQSVVKTFGQGSAKDCRVHVQKLNKQRSENSQNSNEKYDEAGSCYELETAVNNYDDYSLKKNMNESCDLEFQQEKISSKWQKYLESDETNELSDNSNFQKRSLSYSSNSIACDEPEEPVSKKLHSSRDDTLVEREYQQEKALNKWQTYLETDGTNELSDDSNFQKCSLSYSSNSVQRDGRLPRNDTEVEKNVDIDGIDFSSKKVFHFLSNDELELDTIDDILNV